MLGVVDLAAEEGRAGTVFLRFPQHVKGVERRAGRAAQDADDERAVVSDKLLQRGRAEVRHLQKQRPAAASRCRPAAARCCR